MAANTLSGGSCNVEAHLYRNDKLVGIRSSGEWNSLSGVAVTECEQGETLRVRTNDRTCHQADVNPDDLRLNWFSVVLIAMT